MNREEFIVSAAIILFLAFLLGWLSRWLLQRLNMVSEKDLNQFNKISAALHEAEENNEKARVRELELNKKSKIFRKYLAGFLEIKYVPKLKFLYDDTLLHEQRINKLLSKISVKD